MLERLWLLLGTRHALLRSRRDLTLENPLFRQQLAVALRTRPRPALRKRMSVEVYFVDAAWAPSSARGLPDTRRSSVLAAMRAVLLDLLASPDPARRAVYRELYGPFETGFRNIEGLILSTGGDEGAPEGLRPSPAGLEDAMDGWEPEDSLIPLGAATVGGASPAGADADDVDIAELELAGIGQEEDGA